MVIAIFEAVIDDAMNVLEYIEPVDMEVDTKLFDVIFEALTELDVIKPLTVKFPLDIITFPFVTLIEPDKFKLLVEVFVTTKLDDVWLDIILLLAYSVPEDIFVLTTFVVFKELDEILVLTMLLDV